MDGEGKKTGEARPGEAKTTEVLKTGGEASAAGYAEAEVPEGTDCPTIEVDRVRIVPPSQTPTVKIADRAKRAGPRAPEQMVRPKAKGPVELPEGRPVTKMQVIEIDPDFLLGLERGREEADEAGTGAAEAGAEMAAARMESPWVREAPPQVAAVELPSAAGPGSAPVSAPAGKRPGRGALLMGAVLVGVAVFVLAFAATRGPKGAEKAAASAAPTLNATANTTATAIQSTTAAATERTAPPPSTVTSATATTTTAAPAAMKPRGKPAGTSSDPYDAPPPKTAAPAAPPAPVPAPEKTATSAPAPVPTAGKIPEF